MYAYKLQFGKSFASIGLQVSGRRFTNDLSDDRLLAIDGFEQDPAIEKTKYSNTIFNVGVGAYLRSPNFYLGISSPRLIKSNLDQESSGIISREARHIYAMIGSNINITKDWEFKPQLLLKYAEASPLDIDLWTEFAYRDQIFLASNFSIGGSDESLLESFDLMIGFRISKSLVASMAFDFTFTELRKYENGSFEILLKYDLIKNIKPKIIHNPRYY